MKSLFETYSIYSGVDDEEQKKVLSVFNFVADIRCSGVEDKEQKKS